MDKKDIYLSYSREEIGDTTILCSDCITTAGDLSKVYLCPYGIYIVLDNLKFPIRQVYQKLKEIFKTQHIYIYVPEVGLYDYFSDKYIEETTEFKANEHYKIWFEEFVNAEADERYTYEEIKKIEGRLRLEDAENRGTYIDDNGIVYVKKGGKFIEASEIDPDSVFFACIFFGCLGGHRFKLKKYMSGLWYILSFGLLGVGWLLDLLILILGIQKDRHGRILLPVNDVRNKLKYIPIGLALNAIYIFAVVKLINFLL